MSYTRKYTKSGNIYKTSRICGAGGDNFLAITLADAETDIQLIVLNGSGDAKDRELGRKVLAQVSEGLVSANTSLGKNYRIGKIFYISGERIAGNAYAEMIFWLIGSIDACEPFNDMPYIPMGGIPVQLSFD